MEQKIAHLTMIQGVISRMASNSFQLKGWSVVLVSALVALAAKDGTPSLVYVAYLPSLVFWLLDGYFLRQERLFRALYDRVRTLPVADCDFSMDIDMQASGAATWVGSMFSKTLVLFHGVVLAAVVVATVLLGCPVSHGS